MKKIAEQGGKRGSGWLERMIDDKGEEKQFSMIISSPVKGKF